MIRHRFDVEFTDNEDEARYSDELEAIVQQAVEQWWSTKDRLGYLVIGWWMKESLE